MSGRDPPKPAEPYARGTRIPQPPPAPSCPVQEHARGGILGAGFRTFAIGVVAGIGGGLASLGGGTLVIPLLMEWVRLTPLQARGTAIATALFSAGMGATTYALHDQVQWTVVLWVALPSMIVTPLAAAWSERFCGERLKAAFGVVVMVGALLLIFKDFLPSSPTVPDPLRTAYLMAVGVVEGLVAGVVGISGGPVLAPLFVLGLGMPQQLAQGCSLAARLPAVITGTWENARLGNVCWRAVPGLALGALVGAWAGSHAALWLPEHALRTLFGVLLLGLGLYYVRGGHADPERRDDVGG